MYRFRVIAVVLLVAAAARAQAPASPPTTRPVRLLTVGNSFAGNATRYVRDLAAAAGHQLVLGQANPGGCSLERHWKAADAIRNNPDDPAGKIYVVGKDKVKMSLRELLISQPWDYVTIQQASPLSDKLESYFPYADLLHDYIRAHAPQATILIHQTWAYRQDHPKFKAGGEPRLMHQAVRAAYHKAAEKLKLPLVPVGDAMYAAMNSKPFRPDTTFDFAAAAYPMLPRELNSVHLGWRWVNDKKTGKRVLIRDAYHANQRGCYLGSCVFFEFLFGQSAVGNSFVPPGIKPEDARALQHIAHEVVKTARIATGATTRPAN